MAEHSFLTEEKDLQRNRKTLVMAIWDIRSQTVSASLVRWANCKLLSAILSLIRYDHARITCALASGSRSAGWQWAQTQVMEHHYLHAPVDLRWVVVTW